MSNDGYSWVEKKRIAYSDVEEDVPGSWHVDSDTRSGGVDVSLQDCGCCGETDVLHVESVEEFDREWKRIGKMLRTHVRRAVKRGG